MKHKGTLSKKILQSLVLKGNPMGNSSRRELLIYTPPAYERGEVLPCILFLPGFGSGPEKWKNKDFPAHRLMDLLILSGEIPRCLMVCVDGMSRLGGSQYVDSALNGPFMKHLVEEVVPHLNKNFSVNKYMICGHSSGGFGALQAASLHPDIFKRVASFAGDMHFELTHKAMLSGLLLDLRSGKLSPNLKSCLKNKETHYILGLSAAYSANLRNQTWKMDFPINIKTGEINETVWKKWLSFDPVVWAKSRKKNLQKLEMIYLSSGESDPFALQIGMDTFKATCSRLGVKVSTELHPGNHSLLISQLERGVKKLLQ